MVTKLALFLLLFAGQGASQDPKLETYTGPRKRAIVGKIEVKAEGVSMTMPAPSGQATQVVVDIPRPDTFGSGLAEMLQTALVNSNRFIMLERQNLEGIAAEQTLQSSAGFDPKTAFQPGRALGAQFVVSGAITEISYKKTSTSADGVLGIGVGESAYSATVTLDLRISNVGTTEILCSVRAEGKSSSKSRHIGLKKDDMVIGHTAFESSPLGKAVRSAIDSAVVKICEKMEKVPWAARVALVETGDDGVVRVVINAGEKAGLKVGAIFEVCRPGQPIIDPESGLPIGRRDRVIGSCRVESLEAGLCVAVLTSSEPALIEDVIRLPRGPNNNASSPGLPRVG